MTAALAATSRTGWTAALGGSLLLHAALAAALVPLLESSNRRPPPTAISFSEPPPDVIASLPQRSETVAPALRASEPVALAPSAAAVAVGARGRTVTPVGPAAARRQTLTPSDPDGAAVASQPAELLRPGPAAPTLAPQAAEALASPATPAVPAAPASELLAQASSAQSAETVPVAAATAVPAAEAAPASADALAAAPPPALQPALPLTVSEPIPQTGGATAVPARVPAEIAASYPIEGAIAAAPDALPAGTAVVDTLSPAGPALPAGDAGGATATTAPIVQPTAPAAPEGAAAPGAAILPLAAVEGRTPLQPVAGGSVPQGVSAQAGSGDTVAALAPESAPQALAPSARLLAEEAPAADSGAADSGAAVLKPLPEEPEALASAAQALAPAAAELAETDDARRAERRRQAVAFVRGFRGGGDCFAAVPAQGGDAVGFDAFGRNGADMRRFAEAALALGGGTRTTFGDLSAPQCSALVFARGQRNYPDFTLGLSLVRDSIPDNSRLAGRISGADRQPVRLLLIDDEGTVQSLSRFLSAEPEPAFSIPMNLTAGAVRTKQLLIALTATKPLRMLEGEVTEKAPAFFRQLQAEARIAGARLDLALQAFSVGEEALDGAPAVGGVVQ